MSDSPFYERALLLLRQNRLPDAEGELRQLLAGEPRDPRGHALLSIVLARQKKLNSATEAAGQAIAIAPDMAMGHYALATALMERQRFGEAVTAIDQAITLDSDNESYFGLLALIRIQQKAWTAALAAADRGLEIDPADGVCVNARAIALTNLGQKEEASRTIAGALAREPESAATHANQGWTLLHRRKPKEALVHFREALRLDPDSDWARAGVVEAMKARFFVYRWLLAYFLFMARLSSRVQFGILIGGWLGYQFLGSFADTHPQWAWVTWPLIIAYVVFAVLTWLANPLMNLLLLLHPTGRYALSVNQARQAKIVAALLLAAVALAVFAIFSHQSYLLLTAVYVGIALMPASLIFVADPGWPRWTVLGLAMVPLALAGILVFVATGLITGEGILVVFERAPLLLVACVFGSQWVAAMRLRR